MAGEVVPLKPSAEHIADEETKRKAALRAWADDVASKVIAAALEDVARRFLDAADDEELATLDLKGEEYDPIIHEKTGERLSDAIVEFGHYTHGQDVLRS